MTGKEDRLGRSSMLEGPEWKCILRFALPILLGQLLQQLYSTVDGVIVGNFVSERALAAVGASTIVATGFNSVSFGMSAGCAISVGQFFGAGRREDMRSAASTALVVLFSFGLCMTLLGFFAADFIAAHVLDIADPAVRADSTLYLRVLSLGFVIQFFYNSIASILRSVGDSKAALYFLIVSSLVNVCLDLLFVAGLHWGVAGAAAATVIAQIACMSFSYVYMYRNYEIFRFRLREIRPYQDKLRLCVKLGIPTTLQHLVVSMGNVALQRLVDSFGSTTMAAYAVGRTYDHYIAVPCLAAFQSLTSFSGQNTGAGRYDRVKRGAFQAIGMALIAVAALGVVVYAFAPSLSALYGVEGETLKQAVAYLRFISVTYPLMAMYMPMNGLFQGCGDPLAATVSSLIALSARVGAAYAMVYLFNVGCSAGWKSYGIGWGCALIFVAIHFARGKWMTKSIIKESVEETA